MTPNDKTQLVAHFFDNSVNTNSLGNTLQSTFGYKQRGRSALRNATHRTPGMSDDFGATVSSTLGTTQQTYDPNQIMSIQDMLKK